MKTRHPWDRLSVESDEAYARFLIYRNLGPCRSLKRAYLRFLREYDNYQGGPKGITVPHNWRGDCCTHFWVQRSAQWDVRNLTAYGARIVALHSEAIAILARKNLIKAKELEPGDMGWEDLMSSLKMVAAFLSPEIIQGIQNRGKPVGCAVGADAGNVE